jgi:hypothetical protein
MEVDMKQERITLYLDLDFKLALEHLAKQDRRSLNSFILHVLDEDVKSRTAVLIAAGKEKSRGK